MAASLQFDNARSVTASAPQHRCPIQALRNTPLGYPAVIVPTLDPDQAAQWDAITHASSVFLQRPYLLAIESASRHIELRYALFYDGPCVIGAAVYQVVDFVGRSVTDGLDARSALTPLFARWLGFDRDPIACKLVVCGNAVTSGEHGFVFAPHADPARVVASITGAATGIQREISARVDVAGTLIKDLTLASEPTAIRLEGARYIAIKTEPSMVLWMDPAWKSFDDYLASLTSKYRVKAKRAHAKSSRLQVRSLSLHDVLAHEARIQELHEGVTERADYRLGRVCARSLAALRRHMGDRFLLNGYYLDGTLVGFLSGFESQGTLEAHAVGIDYEHNQEHAIYPRMLSDYIQIALDRGLGYVNYGRTAGEIKSTLGAQPVAMTCYFRHRSCVPNGMLRFLSRRFSPPPTVLRMPFKRAWYELHAGAFPAAALPES